MLPVVCVRGGIQVSLHGMVDTGAALTVATRSVLDLVSHGVTSERYLYSIHGSNRAAVHRVCFLSSEGREEWMSVTEIADHPCPELILGADFLSSHALRVRRGYFVTRSADVFSTRPPRTYTDAIELAERFKREGRLSRRHDQKKRPPVYSKKKQARGPGDRPGDK